MRNILFFINLLFISIFTTVHAEAIYEVSEMCGTTKVRLSCDQHNKNCKRVDMFFQSQGQPEKKIDLPKEIKKKGSLFPMGIACRLSADKINYVAIQFDDLYPGCKVCEFPYLYNDQGVALTKSEPLFFEHKKNKSGAGPYGNYPDNIEYIELSKKLKLKAKEYNSIYVPFDY